MECYSHRGLAAVGICKHCDKGVCGECARETGGGLACSDACEHELSELTDLMAKSKRAYGTNTTGNIPATIVVYVSMGLIFIAWGVTSRTDGLAYYLVPMGVIFFAAAAMGAWNRRRTGLSF